MSLKDNPFDALVWELVKIEVKRQNDTEVLGVFVKSYDQGGRPFIYRLAENGPAMRAGMKINDYVLSVNGHRVDTKSQMKVEVERLSGGTVQIVVARRREKPLDPLTLKPPGNVGRRPNFIYHVCRVDAQRRPHVGMAVALVDNQVTVTAVACDGSAYWSGLQARDRLMTIGQEEVKDPKQCDQLLKTNENQIFDILVERPADIWEPRHNVRKSRHFRCNDYRSCPVKQPPATRNTARSEKHDARSIGLDYEKHPIPCGIKSKKAKQKTDEAGTSGSKNGKENEKKDKDKDKEKPAEKQEKQGPP